MMGDSTIARVDLTGGRTEILRENITGFSWGPAGSYFFGIREKGLFWVGKDSSRKQVTAQKSDEGLHQNPQLLPDEKSFLFAKQRTGILETWFAHLDGKDPKLVLSKASQAYYAPPGYLVYMQSDSLVAQRFDASRGVLVGDARSLVTGVAKNTSEPWGEFTVSTTGVLAFRQGSVTNPSRLSWFDRNGNVTGTLGEVSDYSVAALSPDGQRVAVSVRDSSGKRDIWVFDVQRGTKTRITFEPSDEVNPTWSPDGSEIAYSSDRRGHRDIYARPSSGTGQERVVFESDEDKSVEDWSSDGKFLAYTVQNPKTRRDVWLLPMAGSDRKPVLFLGTPANEDQPRFSPDSRWLLYVSNETGRNEIYAQAWPPNGKKWQISNSFSGDPRWSADGKTVFYATRTGTRAYDLMAVDISGAGQELQPSSPKKLFPYRAAQSKNTFIAAKDGQHFLVITPEEAQDPTLTPFVVILNWQRLLPAGN